MTKKTASLAFIVLFALIVTAVIVVFFKKPAKNFLSPNLPFFTKETISSTPASFYNESVNPKNEYANPFDEKTYYENPFETYRNPFEIK